jgi:pullulanase/glycogen debranching enzyme
LALRGSKRKRATTNTQRGNNNPWNQDNETTWLDWDLLQKNSDMFRFFKGMIAFRKAHHLWLAADSGVKTSTGTV